MTAWRSDPDLRARFHPQYPDDLQVIVHDGEPRRTQRAAEACWVRVTGVAGTLRSPTASADATQPVPPQAMQWTERTIYSGTLLNAPHQLATVRQGDTIHFIHAPGLPHVLAITDAYQRERPQWCFVPCNKCGADQTLDPMTTMAQTRFPGTPAGSAPIAFTSFCPCGGTMMLSLINATG